MTTNEHSDQQCVVCHKHRGGVPVPGGLIYDDGLVAASHQFMHDEPLSYPGVLFVEPRRHVGTVADLTRGEAERIGWLCTLLSRALKAEGAVRTYILVHGHGVNHVHYWVIPRYPGLPNEITGPEVIDWTDGPRKSYVEIEQLCGRIRDFVHEGSAV